LEYYGWREINDQSLTRVRVRSTTMHYGESLVFQGTPIFKSSGITPMT